ncbi:MAG: hypothetical protein RsTaC01_0546 [Candidatus Paraimprobicoccus trichonymphae]|uniref:Uncharacterized protein n=1 Tax=Candidatus Paraimprobicoccus trichonymphae TaxID=3033793 RepID=A0AA48IBZ8_9FIRM|nr:MAG: hypothetical protein RsTaC01_0546 [Candidatus Paraimprobicoccus trichonymphae]
MTVIYILFQGFMINSSKFYAEGSEFEIPEPKKVEFLNKIVINLYKTRANEIKTNYDRAWNITEEGIENLYGFMMFWHSINNNGANYEGKIIRLKSDIDLQNNNSLKYSKINQKNERYDLKIEGELDNSKTWNPIGTKEHPFKGIFDGQGHTIKNLTVFESEGGNGEAYAGLFGYTENVSIKNLNIENVNIICETVDNHAQAGAVAGRVIGNLENCHVKNCVIVCKSQEKEMVSAGGLVGSYVVLNDETDDLVLKDCTAEDINVYSTCQAGGIAGNLGGKQEIKSNNNVVIGVIGTVQANNITINNCKIEKSEIHSSGRQTGGLVAGFSCVGNVEITNCEFVGNVTAGKETNNGLNYSSGGQAGGIIAGFGCGRINISGGNVMVDNCYSTGNITGMGQTGGIIAGFGGPANETGINIMNCSSNGDITSYSNQENIGGDAGGIIAGFGCNASNNSVLIQNCHHFNGDVVSFGTKRDSAGNAGGVITSFGTSGNVIIVKDCTNEGKVKAACQVGGLISGFGLGDSGSGVIIENCHHSNGDVISFGTENGRSGNAGGLISGFGGPSVIIENCTTKCSVRAANQVGGLISGVGSKGSIIIENCRHSNGDVISFGIGNAGGLISGFGGPSAIIENCTNECNVSAANQVGGLISGVGIGYSGSSVIIENCHHSNGDVISFGTESGRSGNAGGLISGFGGPSVIIENCTTKCNVRAADQVGGLISGFGFGGSSAIIENCRHSNGDVISFGVGNAGGLISGFGGSGVIIENCTAECNVSAANQVGGLISGFGANHMNTIKNCHHSKGNVESINYSAAGGLIAGFGIDGSIIIENCTNNGDVISDGSGSAGGLISDFAVTRFAIIRDCISEGNVYSKDQSGGLISGFAVGCKIDVNVSITNCHSKGNVTGLSKTGGLIGFCVLGTEREEQNNWCKFILKDNSSKGNVFSENNLAGGLIGGLYSGSRTGITGQIGSVISSDNVTPASLEIANNFSEGDVTSFSDYKFGQAGGLVAQCDRFIAENCHSKGNITTNSGFSGNAGGIVADCNVLDLKKCYSNGNISCNSQGIDKTDHETLSEVAAGGLAGKCNDLQLSESFSYGNVECCSNHEQISEPSYAGGLVGKLSLSVDTDHNVANCFYVGNLNSNSDICYNGGLFGLLDGKENSLNLMKCYAGGTEFITKNRAVPENLKIGGLIGEYLGPELGKNFMDVCYYNTDTTLASSAIGNLQDSFQNTQLDTYKMTGLNYNIHNIYDIDRDRAPEYMSLNNIGILTWKFFDDDILKESDENYHYDRICYYPVLSYTDVKPRLSYKKLFKDIDIQDPETGVWLLSEGPYPLDSSLKVIDMNEGKKYSFVFSIFDDEHKKILERVKFYDIYLKYNNDKKDIEPLISPLMIRIPVPDDFDKDILELNAFRITDSKDKEFDDEKLVIIDGKYYIELMTNHLSYYGITDIKLPENNNNENSSEESGNNSSNNGNKDGSEFPNTNEEKIPSMIINMLILTVSLAIIFKFICKKKIK